jgi:hypothetical protein
VPHGPNPASRVKRCARWCDNARILEAVSFLPYADVCAPRRREGVCLT